MSGTSNDTNYVPSTVTQDPNALARYLTNEFRKISQSINALQQQINQEPKKLYIRETSTPGGAGAFTIAASTLSYSGQGSKFSFTPAVTGRMLIAMDCGIIANTASIISFNAELIIGTGTPPAQNATSSSGSAYAVQTATFYNQNAYTPFCLITAASCTVGKTYWVDVAYGGGGTGLTGCSLLGMYGTIIEL